MDVIGFVDFKYIPLENFGGPITLLRTYGTSNRFKINPIRDNTDMIDFVDPLLFAHVSASNRFETSPVRGNMDMVVFVDLTPQEYSGLGTDDKLEDNRY